MKKTSATEMEHWLENLNNGFTGGACHTPRFLKPYHLVTLATELKRYAEKNINLPEALFAYVTRMKLWEAIDVAPPYDPEEITSHAGFLPVEPLKSSDTVATSAEALLALIKPHCSNPLTIESLRCMLLELLDNCFSHAAIDHSLHGIVCCQPWRNGNLAQIALADSGIGIRSSLLENHDLKTRLKRENACELATEFGVTSKPQGRHSGYGLALTRELMEQTGGNLLLISGSEVFQSCEGKSDSDYLETPWHGTLLVMEWNMDAALNVETIYQRWPLPKGLTAEDFD